MTKQLRIYVSRRNPQIKNEYLLFISELQLRYSYGCPIGNRVVYTKEEAIKEAKEIAENLELSNDVTEDAPAFNK